MQYCNIQNKQSTFTGFFFHKSKLYKSYLDKYKLTLKRFKSKILKYNSTYELMLIY